MQLSGEESSLPLSSMKAFLRSEVPRLTMVRASLIAAMVVVVLAGVVGAAPGKGQRGAVATVHPLASEAAIQAMQSGGNAVDAAVAAGLTLGVVDGFNSGVGGGCFMVIRRADGSVVAIDGREKAPDAATRDMFVRDGKGDSRLSQTGALAIGVPGSLAVYDHAIRSYGKLSLRQHLLAAAEIAEKGFPLSRTYVPSTTFIISHPVASFQIVTMVEHQ